MAVTALGTQVLLSCEYQSVYDTPSVVGSHAIQKYKRPRLSPGIIVNTLQVGKYLGWFDLSYNVVLLYMSFSLDGSLTVLFWARPESSGVPIVFGRGVLISWHIDVVDHVSVGIALLSLMLLSFLHRFSIIHNEVDCVGREWAIGSLDSFILFWIRKIIRLAQFEGRPRRG